MLHCASIHQANPEVCHVADPVITAIAAREVLDCRGLPTVQAELELDGRHLGRADVPSGRSTGSYEAVELRDGGPRFGGFGVTRAVESIRGEIADALVGRPLASQRKLDTTLIDLDGHADKGRLGANALLGVSLAAARAAALAADVPLYRHLNAASHTLPAPLVNLINGGRHASNDLDFQEFIIVPVGAGSLLEALQLSTEVNLALAELLSARYGKVALNTGDEGGFAPPIGRPQEALELLHEAVAAAGYDGRFVYGLDCAATHFYDADAGVYTLAGETYTPAALADLYRRLIDDYGVVTIEDPFQEDDFEGFAALTASSHIQIVGDDLFVTNPERLRQGLGVGAANALLWKVNQIGTLTEALDVARLAHRSGLNVVVSERSGETEDPIIADLAVAIDAGQIKTGAPVRGERTAKYNRLLQIAEELDSSGRYANDALAGVVEASARPSA
jgi:enolase